MIEFFQAGGFSMWFILALGLVTCVSGVLYAKARTRPALVRLALFSVATFFAAVAGLASDLATVFMKVPAHPEWSKSPDLHLIVMTGIGESLTPVVLGSALLMIAWTIAAAGHFEFGGRSTGPEPVPTGNR